MEKLFYHHSHNNFNAIRILSALFVIFSHVWDIPGNGANEPLRRFLRADLSFSFLGLGSFFLISGFLITQSRIRSGSLKEYAIKRCLRIFPGLIVVVLLTAILYGPVLTSLPVKTYFSTMETYTYLKNVLIFQSQGDLPGVFTKQFKGPINGSLWTLPYECVCYILLPLLMPIIVNSKMKLILVIAALLLANYYMLQNPLFANMYSPKVNMYRGSLVFFSSYFAIGSLIYIHHRDIPFRKSYFWLTLIAFIILLKLAPTGATKVASPLFLGYLVFCLAFWPSRLAGFGKNSDFSYGIYIYAFPIQLIVIYYFNVNDPLLSLIATLFMVLPLSMFSWYFVESPCLKLKHQFNRVSWNVSNFHYAAIFKKPTVSKYQDQITSSSVDSPAD